LTSCDTQLARQDARPSRLRRVLVYSFALACLVWVFHDIHLRPLISAVTVHYWRFVAIAVSFDILTYALQGMRWSLLLASVGRLGSVRATQAIYAGLFVNELVPLRFGEVVRAFLVSRWLSLQFVSVLPSMIVERFLDGLWLLATGIGIAAIAVPLPKQIVKGETLSAESFLSQPFSSCGWLYGNQRTSSQRNREGHLASPLSLRNLFVDCAR
jgi:glycosyltransferase 2 family protein